MRYPAQQIQLPLNPPQNPLARRQKPNIPQTPEISRRRAAQVPEEGGVRDEEGDDADEREGGDPGRDVVVQDGEVRVRAPLLDALVRQ